MIQCKDKIFTILILERKIGAEAMGPEDITVEMVLNYLLKIILKFKDD